MVIIIHYNDLKNNKVQQLLSHYNDWPVKCAISTTILLYYAGARNNSLKIYAFILFALKL